MNTNTNALNVESCLCLNFPIRIGKEGLNFRGEVQHIVLSNLPDKHLLLPFFLQISFCCSSQF